MAWWPYSKHDSDTMAGGIIQSRYGELERIQNGVFSGAMSNINTRYEYGVRSRYLETSCATLSTQASPHFALSLVGAFAFVVRCLSSLKIRRACSYLSPLNRQTLRSRPGPASSLGTWQGDQPSPRAVLVRGNFTTLGTH